MKLDIYGRMEIEVIHSDNHWTAYRLGNEGKKRKLHEISIPAELSEQDVLIYLEDIFHECATPNNTNVRIMA